MIFKSKIQINLGRIHLRCACGKEYGPAIVPRLAQTCPACGRRVPKAVRVNDGPWISYQEHKRNGLQQMQEAGDSDDLPEEFREMSRRNLMRQIRQLEDGSWKAEARDRIALLKRMIDAKTEANFSTEQRDAMRAMRPHYETQMQALKEELEDAGEPYDDAAASAVPQFFTGVFTRPRVTRREWEEDPMYVAQKVAGAIALQIKPDSMTQVQRDFVSAWHYASAIDGGGGHGEILCNAAGDDTTAKTIPEALHAIGATAHVAVFQKAVEQWASKPRQYKEFPGTDREKLAKWVKEIHRPICEEFNGINEDARRATPSLEKCLVDYLNKHQSQFFEFADA